MDRSCYPDTRWDVARILKIAELSGILDEYGPLGDGFTGQLDLDQLPVELAGAATLALAHDFVDRIASLTVGRKAGRRRNIMIRELGQRLLTIYLRCNLTAGRT